MPLPESTTHSIVAPSAPIPYGRQHIAPEDIQAVVDVLQGDWLTQGPAIPQFEQAISDYCVLPGESFHSVAVTSATAGLHMACLAAGVGPGDVVWTSPITFVASSNCALYCGASVDFVDIDPATYNISVEALEAKLKSASIKPKVLIPVHMAGQSCDMQSIYQLAKLHGITVIEDAAHAIGGRYQNQAIGGCQYSDMTVFSFHPVKIITTGEGGMVTTRSKVLHDKLTLLRSHGITRDPDQMTEPSHGPWYYQQLGLGLNYRMTDIQAALGVSQMVRLDAFVTRRHELATRYNQLLQDLPITLPYQHPDTYSAYHLYIIRLQLEQLPHTTHRQVFEALRASGIGVNLHYIPVYLQPYYQAMGFPKGYCPQAEAYYQSAITLPLYYGLTEAQQDRVVASLTHALSV